ncbi:hypothetical protein LTR84_011876 [Exophiala bonariae]|uniref:Enoyl reductase (ER) domain-containing protein n=1 Tax=Exophiala bonariae TaxID=1690606 RepID=A0AAV9NIT5_9EURO|nr:hypothetical protein LTR84_011876 [Exophiala bonariae]
MKELLISAGPMVSVIESPIPSPSPGQVIIKVVVCGANPKDWSRPERYGGNVNQGDDIAGTVYSIGDDVVEFKVGDKVAAFHEMGTPGGGYAQYSVAWAYTSFHIPKGISFEEAATIPSLACMTAAMALFSRLPLPQPWSPVSHPLPLIINGASSSVGCYAIQLALRANIHPLILIAGQGATHVETLIDRSKGDTIVDYRGGPQAIVSGIRDALRTTGLGDNSCQYAFDVISSNGSWKPLLEVIKSHRENAAITLLRPLPADTFPQGVQHSRTGVGGCHSQLDTRDWDPDLAYVFFRLFARGLQDGWLRGHPWEVRAGGLDAVEAALKDLKEGKNSAKKYVFRIAETSGLQDS